MNKITWIHFSVVLLTVFFGTSLCSGAIEDPGPFPVGWRDVRFEDDIYHQGMINGRMFYPGITAGKDAVADPALGPFILVGFLHGYLGRPSGYDDLCTHIASWGFVVASIGTETGIFPDVEQYARDMRSFLHWVEREAGDSSCWLFGMTGDGDWSAVGHSMGGGTLSLLIEIEPRISTIVGLQSGPLADGVENMRDFTGNAFQIAGGVDRIVPAEDVYKWYYNAFSARRKIYYLVEGMGHTGCVDDPPNWEPLPGAEQARIHRKLVTGLLRAEMMGEEDLYADLIGYGLDQEPILRQVSCKEPPFWVDEDETKTDRVLAGLGGWVGGQSFMAWSLSPDSVATSFGVLGLNPEQGEIFSSKRLKRYGVHEEYLTLDPAWSGLTLYFQGLVLDDEYGRFTRVVELEIP